MEIRVPKRPRTALSGSCSVDHAPSSLRIQKDTVAVRVFDQTFSSSHAANKFVPKGGLVHLHRFGHREDFLGADPYVTRCATATVAALGTCEPQTVLIPRQLRFVASPHSSTPQHYRTLTVCASNCNTGRSRTGERIADFEYYWRIVPTAGAWPGATI